MLYKVTIKKKIGASLACHIQTIWVDADDLKPDDPYLEDRLIGIISLNEDKLTDKCIYDVTLKDSPDIQTVEILPVSKKPYWMSDDDILYAKMSMFNPPTEQETEEPRKCRTRKHDRLDDYLESFWAGYDDLPYDEKKTIRNIYEPIKNGIEWADANPDLDNIIHRYQTLQDKYYEIPYHPYYETESRFIRDNWNNKNY